MEWFVIICAAIVTAVAAVKAPFWASIACAAVICAELLRIIAVINDREAMHDDPDEPEARR